MVRIKLYLLLVAVLLSSLSQSKKFEINKCILANGTVSFQEDKCDVDVYNRKPKKHKQLQTKPQKKTVKRQKFVKKPTHKAVKRPQRVQNTKFQSTNNEFLHATVGRYQMIVSLPKQWKYFNKVYSNKLYHIKMHNKQAGLTASLMIDFVFPDNKNFSQKEIDELVHLLGSRFVKKSKETQVNIQNFMVSNGKGAITTFTSKEHIPKYRYTTKGAIFKNKWLIQFTLLSNNLQGISHKNALYALSQTIRITSR